MRRPRVLVGTDARPGSAARVRALGKTCETAVVSAPPADRALPGDAEVRLFAAGLSLTAKKTGAEALVLVDGPVARAALRLGRIAGLPTALWTAAGDGAPEHLPGPQHGLTPWPDEVWWSGPRRAGERLNLLPGAFRVLGLEAAARRAAAWASGEDAAAAERGHTTIVVPCWNGLADTKVCVAAVLKHTRAPFTLTLVDNGSTDGTAAWARGLKDRRVKVLANATNEGFARAVNRGLATATGPYAVWLNNDCVVTPGWLERLRDALERAPWIGAVGPMTDGAGGLQKAAGKGPAPRDLDRYAAAWALKHRGRMTWAHRLVGFCVLHRTALLKEAGYLDERFGLGCYEDFDWCLRVRQAGYELYAAEDCFVSHRGQASFRGNRLDHAAIVRGNRDLLVDKWCRKGLQFLDELDGPLSGPRKR